MSHPEAPPTGTVSGRIARPARGFDQAVWISWLPGLQTLRSYEAACLGHDLVAGPVLAAMLVPVGIAYAVASGLPGIFGLYATIVPLLAYALFSHSRILVLGRDSALAALILPVVLQQSGGDPIPAVALAGTMAAVCGSACLLNSWLQARTRSESKSSRIRGAWADGCAALLHAWRRCAITATIPAMNALAALITNTLLIMVFAFTIPGAARAETPTAPSELSIGLALGSGGAVGLAHIAMLQVFDDLGIRPQMIAGTSIGAVIGALYASGLTAKDIRAIFDEFGGSSLDAMSALMDDDVGLDLGELLTIDMSNGGLIDQSAFLRFLASKTTARTFADLEIPLKVVATDYWSGDTIVLDRGDLFEAVEGSMAVPGLFAPLKRDERLLIDGGTSDPLPWTHLTGCCDIIVAVDVSGSRHRSDDGLAPLLDVLFNTFEIMQQSIVAEKMRHGEPDIYIKPDISGIRLLHFNRIKTILEQAEPAARELRDAIEQRLDPRVLE